MGKRVWCHLCVKSFKSRLFLHSHINRRHCDEHPFGASTHFQCLICSKVFGSDNYLVAHIERCHLTKGVNFKCHACPKSFVATEYLEQHKDNNHRCLHCDVESLSSEDLSIHIKNEHFDKTEAHVCQLCRKDFATLPYLKLHIRRKHQPRFHQRWRKTTFCCQFCASLFTSNPKLNQHVIRHHECHLCSGKFSTRSVLLNHVKGHERTVRSKAQIGYNVNQVITPGKFSRIKAFGGYITNFEFIVSSEVAENLRLHTIRGIYDYLKTDIVLILKQSIVKFFNIRAQLIFILRFRRSTSAESYEYVERRFNTYEKVLLNTLKIDEKLNEALDQVLEQVNVFERYGSGWILVSALGINLKVNKFVAGLPGCYISLPKEVAAKKCVINVDNKHGVDCFKWAVLSILHPVRNNSNQMYSYTGHVNKYVWNENWFPMKDKNIETFERLNNIACNVFGWDYMDKVYPLRISDFNYKDGFITVNLLKIHHDEKKFHYCGIKDINRLHLGKQNQKRRQLCFHCLHSFSMQVNLPEHVRKCKLFLTQKIKMPKMSEKGEKPVTKFEKYLHKIPVPYVAYVDFECILRKINDGNRTAIHIPCGVCIMVVHKGEVVDKIVYRGEDCVDVFFEHIDRWGQFVANSSHETGPMVITDEQEQEFLQATICHICEEPLGEERCRDHSHQYPFEYRGSSHTHCNLQFKEKKKLVIILHNFKSYDCHIIIHGFQRFKGSKKFEITPGGSAEKIMSIECDDFVFIDSLQFLSASQDKLMASLIKSYTTPEERREVFGIMHQLYRNLEQVSHLLRKGIYPYDYMDSFEKFEETNLPSKESFKNQLTKSDISNDDYKYAQKTWDLFNCKNMGDFHDRYLEGDVAQLACIFEDFRKFCIREFKLDSAHYVSLPGWAWDSCLFFTKVKLDQFTDLEKHMFVEDVVKGGLSQISKRFAEANNKYQKDYDPKVASSYIMYYDCNALYGHTMREMLPVSDFEWLTDEELTKFDVTICDEFGEEGYFVECSLDYPESLHDRHCAYPLCPEKMVVTNDQLGDFQKNLLNAYSENEGGRVFISEKTPRLILHLGKREKVVLHYRNLMYYLKKGMKLIKYHKVLKFKQRAWLKEFVDFCANKRLNAKSDLEGDRHKLTVNAIFGRSMQNQRKKVSVALANRVEQAIRYASQANLVRWDILAPELVYFVMNKRTAFLNKPIHNGATILALSKLKMYEFYYDKLMEWYDHETCQLLFTDTDSFGLQIFTDDVYEDMAKHLDEFDTHNYDPEHPLYSTVNKKVTGKFKDELGGKIGKEFVGLCSKMYSLITEDEFRKVACKGTPAATIKKELTHALFKTMLQSQTRYRTTSTTIRSHGQFLYSEDVGRVSLTNIDIKVHIDDDGIHTKPYNHYKLRK